MNAIRQISDMISLFDVKSIELLLKVGGHHFDFFEEDFVKNMNDLMWMIPKNPAVIHIYNFHQMYDHILTVGELDGYDSRAYKLASSYVALKYKKKFGKKQKQHLIEKYNNFIKSKKMQYFTMFKQSMYYAIVNLIEMSFLNVYFCL